jgi:hypothetical protein
MEPDLDQATIIIDSIEKPASEQTAQTCSSSSGTLKLEKPRSSDEQHAEEASDLSANSLKCDDCGMLLKDEDFATLHAHKTGHVNFSQSIEQIKPKTKEEIEEQKKRLEEKLRVLREEKKRKEAEEQLEREKSRRKEGRQLNEIKQKYAEDEMKRIAEQKRREKMEDAEYKRKVKEQIARDREAMRRERESEQQKTPVTAPAHMTQAAPQQPVAAEKKEYDECRIQIRLTDGKVLQHTFRAKEQLAAVRLWIDMNRTDVQPGSGAKFQIMQTFPRKVYTEDDMMRSLQNLGLVPASSLVIQRV